MKKILALIFLIFNLIALVGCDPSSSYYNYEELYSNVESVELILYENENAKELFEKRGKVLQFDFSKVQIIEILDDDKKQDFLMDFSKIEFMLVWRHLDSPKGESIKINYIDVSFDIICYKVQFSCQYDAEGNVENFIGSGGGYQLEQLVKNSFY